MHTQTHMNSLLTQPMFISSSQWTGEKAGYRLNNVNVISSSRAINFADPWPDYSLCIVPSIRMASIIIAQ